MSSSVSAYVSLVEWYCGRCGELFDDNDCVDYPMQEGDRVPGTEAMDCYPENGHTGHDDYGDICDDCYDLVENTDDEREQNEAENTAWRLIAQREVINGHLENLVKIMEVQHG